MDSYTLKFINLISDLRLNIQQQLIGIGFDSQLISKTFMGILKNSLHVIHQQSQTNNLIKVLDQLPKNKRQYFLIEIITKLELLHQDIKFSTSQQSMIVKKNLGDQSQSQIYNCKKLCSQDDHQSSTNDSLNRRQSGEFDEMETTMNDLVIKTQMLRQLLNRRFSEREKFNKMTSLYFRPSIQGICFQNY